MPSRIRELLRVEYLKDAYADQTGAKHWGYVAYEQILVRDSDEHFDVDDGYKVHEGHGVVALGTDGRRFKVWSETVSYSGGTNVAPWYRDPGLKGHWVVAPLSLAGYVTPEGVPLEHVIDPPSRPRASFPLTNETIDEHVASVLRAKEAQVSALLDGPRQKVFDPIFGDAFGEAAVRTVHLALEEGTEEAFANAVAELRGITRAATYLNAGPGTILTLSAEQNRMQQLADDPELRAQVLSALQEGSKVAVAVEEPGL